MVLRALAARRLASSIVIKTERASIYYLTKLYTAAEPDPSGAFWYGAPGLNRAIVCQSFCRLPPKVHELAKRVLILRMCVGTHSREKRENGTVKCKDAHKLAYEAPV